MESQVTLKEIDTPVASQFAAWLTAFNSGNRAEMLAYHEVKFPYDNASEDIAGIDRELGQHLWKSNVDTLPYRGMANAGGYSTVTDLLAFANALTMCRLLHQTHTSLLTTGKVIDGDTVQYAYGFEEWIEGGIRRVGHHGGSPSPRGCQ